MRLIRSWPRHVPPGRGHVVDDIEHLVIDNMDYRALGAVDGDVLLLEWDIAVAKEDLLRFAAVASEHPEQVLVAPYRIYYEHMLPEPVWAHRHWDGEPRGMCAPVGAVPVSTEDPTCNLFGLGMAYLPGKLVHRFLQDGWANHFGDVEFSMWHYLTVRREVPICWDVHPVHLNYQTPQV
jgi:hypothetical protein